MTSRANATVIKTPHHLFTYSTLQIPSPCRGILCIRSSNIKFYSSLPPFKNRFSQFRVIHQQFKGIISHFKTWNFSMEYFLQCHFLIFTDHDKTINQKNERSFNECYKLPYEILFLKKYSCKILLSKALKEVINQLSQNFHRVELQCINQKFDYYS